jgi:hydroxymethylpyrimidine pyrophosphatase-like HAD family hydrolase
MKPLTDLTKEDIKNIKVICFDSDGVSVPKGTEITETEDTLSVKTHTMPDYLLKKIIQLKKYYHLTFSSGRSLMFLDRMYGKILWENASLQGENGIFTLIDGRVIQNEKFSPEILEVLNNIKVDLRILASKNKKIRGFEPKQFLITLHAFEDVPEVYDIVKKHDTKNELYNLWNGEAYDIGLKHLNKGTALKNLCDYLGFSLSQAIAIGNGPNDKAMVDAAGIGVTTDPTDLKTADFHTTKNLELGGEELVDKLLELNK